MLGWNIRRAEPGSVFAAWLRLVTPVTLVAATVGVAVPVLIAEPTYYSWVAGGLLTLAFVVVALVRPLWALVLGIIAVYNPYFNYVFLYAQEFRGASTRAAISSLVMTILSITILSRVAIGLRPLRMGGAVQPRHIVLLALVVFSIVNGLYLQNDARLLASDLFPIIEFCGFYFVTRSLIDTQDDAMFLLSALLAWGTTAALADILLYAVDRQIFVSHFALGGIGAVTVHRLVDFMPALLLPLAVGQFALQRRRKMQLLLLISITVLGLAVALSFFRSLYVGIAVALLVIFFLASRGGLLRLASRYAVLTVAGVAGAIVLGTQLLQSSAYAYSANLVDLIAGRIGYIEPTSGTARIADNLAVFELIANRPLGVGLGGQIGGLPLFSMSNYYLSFAAELGALGVVVLMWVAFKFLHGCFTSYRQGQSVALQSLALSVLGSFASMGAVALTFPSMLHFPIPAYLAVLAAMLHKFDTS